MFAMFAGPWDCESTWTTTGTPNATLSVSCTCREEVFRCFNDTVTTNIRGWRLFDCTNEAEKPMTAMKYLVSVMTVSLFQTGIEQIELNGLAELTGAWGAETHFHWK